MCLQMYRTSRNNFFIILIVIFLLYSCVNEYYNLPYVEECHKIQNIVFLKTHKVK